MSAATTGRLVESGFQSTLNDLISRMAIDHPYHVLYQIFALRNGNLGSGGKVERGPVSMVMSRDVDLDKVSIGVEPRLNSVDLCFDAALFYYYQKYGMETQEYIFIQHCSLYTSMDLVHTAVNSEQSCSTKVLNSS